MKGIFGIWIACAVVSVVLGDARCPKPHQQYKECGSACAPTCRNPAPEVCILMCVTGCFCETGYYKNDNGDCVTDCPRNLNATATPFVPSQCPKPHQIFKECGSACAPTCVTQTPAICTMQCVSGCFCEDGYIKDGQGNCIQPTQCGGVGASPTTRSANQCPARQRWNTCGSACQPTCRNQQPEICTEQCIAACFCESGLVKDDNGNCVEPRNCPGDQPTTSRPGQCNKPNQEYNECGTACESTCANRSPGICTMNCVRGCFCKSGFVKDSQGNCVEPRNCPSATPGQCNQPNQEFKECGSACEATCETQGPQICTMQCVQGCFCKSGFVKNAQGACVEPSRCPATRSTRSPTCGRNAEYVDCRNPCPITCDNPNPPMCKPVCPSPGCQCKPGFVKNASGQCILPMNCNRQSTSQPDECKPNPCANGKKCIPQNVACFVAPCPQYRCE